MQDEVTQTDWRQIASAAGRLGIRYRTNAALMQFLVEIAPHYRAQAERDTLGRMEPVAWLNETEDDRWLSFDREDPDAISCDFTATSLYALPPAPEAGQ